MAQVRASLKLPDEISCAHDIVTSKVMENRAYILCNETEQNVTLAQLQGRTQSESSNNEEAKQDTVHIGFSVWFNLDLIAITQPRCAVILDISPSVNIVYQLIQHALTHTDTPELFIQLLIESLTPHEKILPLPIASLTLLFHEELTKKNGFLSSESGFLYVKSLHQAGNILFGLADLTNAVQMMALKKWCLQNSLRVDTLYLSNIPEWIIENTSQKLALLTNLAELQDKNTTVIDAFYPTTCKKNSGPPQRITQGTALKFEVAKRWKHASFFKSEANPASGSSNENPNLDIKHSLFS
jgi:hypothetical protein